MTLPSPNVLINGTSQFPVGVNVADGSSVTLALTSATGVYAWNVLCTGTDDLNTAAAINATLVINRATFTATFTAPTSFDGYGAALIFQSTVNNGIDIDGLKQNYLTTTFGVYVETVVPGVRVGAQNETAEGDITYGWITKFNKIIRSGVGSNGTFLGGDVTGPSVTNTVTRIQNNNVTSGNINKGQVLFGTASNTWGPTTISGDISSSSSTAGLLTVTGIQSNTFTSGAPTKGQFVVATTTSNYGPVTISGDITESATTAGLLTVTGIQSNTFTSGAPTKGQFVVATTTSNYGPVTISGDITESATTAALLKVTSLQGTGLSATAPTSNQVLQYNGSIWIPTTYSLPPTGTAGGDLSGTYPNPTVIALQTNAVQSGTLSSLQDGYVLTWTNGSSQWQARPVGSTIVAGQDYSFSNTSSDISGYLQLFDNATGSESDLSASSSFSFKTLIKAFASVLSSPDVDLIPAGAWEFNFYAYASLTGAFTTTLVFDVYKRAVGGTETLLFSATSANIQVTAVQLYTLLYNNPTDFYILNTDRIVIKVYVVSSNVVSTTGHFVFDGVTHASLVRTPLAGAALQLGGDLSGTTSAATVISVSNNNDILAMNVNSMRWHEDASPVIYQNIHVPTSGSAENGGNFFIYAQDGQTTTGANIPGSTGGKLILQAGGGGYTNLGQCGNGGDLRLQSGSGASGGGGADGVAGAILLQTGTLGAPHFSPGVTRLTVNNTGVITIANLGTGLVHADSSGNLTSSTLANADIATAAIAVSKLTAGTSSQVLLNNATPTPTWTTLSGDVTVGATGTTTIKAISGSTPIAITPNELQWINTASAPLIDQAALASTSSGAGAAGADLTIMSQAGQAATGAAHNGGTGGNIIIESGAGGTSGSATAGIGGRITLQTDGASANQSILMTAGASGSITMGTNNFQAFKINSNQTLVFFHYGTGLLHSDSSGNVTSSTLVNADVSGSAAIVYSKLNLATSIVNSDVATAAAIAVSKLAAGTSAQVLLNSATPTPTWTTLSGDATIGNTGVITVTGLQTNPVKSQSLGASQDGYVLTWVNADSKWEAEPITSSSTVVLAGDVTGVSNANTVAKIQNNTVTAGSITKGQVLFGTASNTWGPTTVSGDISSSSSTAGLLTVIAISGTTPIVITPAELQWINSTSSPLIDQVALASTSGGSGSTGQNFSITAQAGQAATGAAHNGGNGGDVILTSGAGGTSGSATAGVAGKIVLGGGRNVSVSSLKTSNYTVLRSDFVVGIGTLSSSITITLPASPATGDTYHIKDVNGTCYQFLRNDAATLTTVGQIITITPASGNIDGQASWIMSIPYQSVTVVYTGSQWSII